MQNAHNFVHELMTNDALSGLWNLDRGPIDFSKITRLVKDPKEPQVLTPGSKVYNRSGRELTFKHLPDRFDFEGYFRVNSEEEVITAEENLVPADKADPKDLDIVAYPAPKTNRPHKNLNWFARIKKGGKFESFGRTKKDAIHKVAVAHAFNEIWGT